MRFCSLVNSNHKQFVRHGKRNRRTDYLAWGLKGSRARSYAGDFGDPIKLKTSGQKEPSSSQWEPLHSNVEKRTIENLRDLNKNLFTAVQGAVMPTNHDFAE